MITLNRACVVSLCCHAQLQARGVALALRRRRTFGGEVGGTLGAHHRSLEMAKAARAPQVPLPARPRGRSRVGLRISCIPSKVSQSLPGQAPTFASPGGICAVMSISLRLLSGSLLQRPREQASRVPCLLTYPRGCTNEARQKARWLSGQRRPTRLRYGNHATGL